MGTLGVVEVDPLTDDPFGLKAVRQFVQVNRFVLEGAPEPLDEDVVHASAPTVHGDRDIGILEHTGEAKAGELGGFNRSSQQLDKGGCDDDSKAALRSIRAEQVAFARPTPDSATGELSAVLGVDRCRLFD